MAQRRFEAADQAPERSLCELGRLKGHADPGFAKEAVRGSRTTGTPRLVQARLRILNPSHCVAALGTALAAARPGLERARSGESTFNMYAGTGLVCWVRSISYALAPSDE